MAYAIAFPLASIPEDLYSFTCCPDSSVVERHLGKMEVPGSIPGRGSDKPVSSEAGFFCLPIFSAYFLCLKPGLHALSARLDTGHSEAPEKNTRGLRLYALIKALGGAAYHRQLGQ